MSVEKTSLSSEERDIFDIEFPRLAKIYLPHRAVSEVFDENYDYILETCEVMKKQFKGIPFQGMNARSGGFGWGIIRPQDVAKDHWTWRTNVTSINTSSHTDWIGTSSAYSKLDDEAGFCLLGFIDYSKNPIVADIQYRSANTTYPIWHVQPAMRFRESLNLFVLPKPLRQLPESTFYVTCRYDGVGTHELAFLGVLFAKGTYLLAQDSEAEV